MAGRERLDLGFGANEGLRPPSPLSEGVDDEWTRRSRRFASAASLRVD